MFSLLSISQSKKNAKAEAEKLYREILRQSRLPVFYERAGVPDTVDGRFEMIVLHMVLFVYCLSGQGRDGAKTAQALFDRVFRDMDMAIREIGVGDLSVGKHMKRMASAYNGRLQAYENCLPEKCDRSALMEAFVRNLYGTVEDKNPLVIEHMADYMIANAEILMRDGASADFRFLPAERFILQGEVS